MYRPSYVNPLSKVGKPWFYIDMNIEKYFDIGIGKFIIFLEIQNVLNRKNSQIINPVTGRAYEYGDPTQYPPGAGVPSVNDPMYPDLTYPVDPFPYNPARYLNPRTFKLGFGFRF